jgi:hypothetical protein
MKVRLLVFLGLMGLQAGCREIYDPEVTSENLGVLVVEGYLDTEGSPSEIQISRTVPLLYDTIASPESGALVFLTAATGESFELPEISPGIYHFEKNIAETGVYRLEIELRNGERYQSLEIHPIISPEIIEAGFVKDEEGVEIFVNTQGNEIADDFLWTYEENWTFRPYTQVPFIFDTLARSVRDRTPEEQIYNCFRTERNPGILLETSSRFQDQVVFRQTITEIPTGNERLQTRYSVLITQKAIPSDAVKFWEILKKNTEDIGSIFSPLPSLISGNIVSWDGDRPVIGQVTLGVIRQKRIYIDREEVSPWPYRNDLFDGCLIEPEPVLIGTSEFNFLFGGGKYLPARPYTPEGSTKVLGYFAIEERCGDCSLYADLTVPDFWEDE